LLEAAESVSGALLESRDLDGRTPLHIAAASGQEQAARTLLDRGADPAAVTRGGETAIELAAAGNRPEHSAAGRVCLRRMVSFALRDARGRASREGFKRLHGAVLLAARFARAIGVGDDELEEARREVTVKIKARAAAKERHHLHGRLREWRLNALQHGAGVLLGEAGRGDQDLIAAAAMRHSRRAALGPLW